MAKLEEYRKYARECRSLADTVRTEYERQLLIRMAQDWIILVRMCEGHLLNDSQSFRRTDQGAVKGPDVV